MPGYGTLIVSEVCDTICVTTTKFVPIRIVFPATSSLLNTVPEPVTVALLNVTDTVPLRVFSAPVTAFVPLVAEISPESALLVATCAVT